MKKQYTRVFAALLTVAIATWSCSDEIHYESTPPDPSTIRAVIGNEGQFGAGTASLTTLSIGGEVKQDLFRAANERPIGDVVQSISKIGEHFYVSLNNSRKVEVMEASTFKSVRTIITPERSIPTYMVHLGGDSVAISDKGYTALLMIASTTDDKIRRQFKVGATNQMRVFAGKLFLAGSELRVFSLSNLTLDGMRKVKSSDGKSISVVGDSQIVLDKNNKIWVMSSTNLVCIDPITESVVKEIPMGAYKIDMWGGRLGLMPDGETMVFSAVGNGTKGQGIASVNINASAMQEKYMFEIPAAVNTLFNMAVSPEGTVFICDVQFGSLARGKVHEFTPAGEPLGMFEAGIFPQYIFFPKR